MKRFLALYPARIPLVFGLAIALVASGTLRVAQLVGESQGQPLLGAAIEQFANWLLLGMLIVAIITACESALPPGLRRAGLQIAALALGTLLFARFVGTSSLLTINYDRLGLDKIPGLFLYILWLGWAMSALLSWYYLAREKATGASQALHRARLARQHTEQSLLESRLQVLEAQIEPRFLLDTLTRVQHLYEHDPSYAEGVLDDLIDYLRAALPQLRERASTLGREFGLVDAYLRIVSAQPHRIRRPEAGLERAYAPPMVLLPIVQVALAAGIQPKPLAMDANGRRGRTEVRIDFEVQAGWNPPAEVLSLQSTLSLLFGSEGRFALSTAGTRATATVSWPALNSIAERRMHPIPAQEEQ